MKTKAIFCANCQVVKPHVVTLNDGGEYVFTCDCSRFVKFAGTLSAEELATAIALHKTQNEGQVPVAVLEQQLDEKLALLDEISDEA